MHCVHQKKKNIHVGNNALVGFEALLGGRTVGVRSAVASCNNLLTVLKIVGSEKNQCEIS